MKAWEPVLGKLEKKVPVVGQEAVSFLNVSRGGQGPTVGLTRMSRGRAKEAEFTPHSTFTTTAGSGFFRKRASPDDGGKSPVRERLEQEGAGWYMDKCQLDHPGRITPYERVGKDIGVERIMKSIVAFAEKDEMLKPLMPSANAKEMKEFLAYNLGCDIAPYRRKVSVWRAHMIEQRKQLGITEQHFDRIFQMIRGAVMAISEKRALMLEVDTMIKMHWKDISTDDGGKKRDKKTAFWEVLVAGGKEIPHTEKLVNAICQSARVINDAETNKMVMRVFGPSSIKVTKTEIVETGLRICFETVPELYEDRIRCQTLDLRRVGDFMRQLKISLGISEAGAASGEEEQAAEQEPASSSSSSSSQQVTTAAAEGEEAEAKPQESFLDAQEEEPSAILAAGEAGEEEPESPVLSPLVEQFESAVDEKSGWDKHASPSKALDSSILSQVNLDADSSQVAELQSSLKTLTKKYTEDVDRMQTLLKAAKERILELEALEATLPEESRKAQTLIYHITNVEVKRTAHQIVNGAMWDAGMGAGEVDDASPASTLSMQMLEACPTPRQGDASFLSAASMPADTDGGPSFVRLGPGESLDIKLREWITASQRLMEGNRAYQV